MSMSTSIDQLTEDQQADIRLLTERCNEVFGAENVDSSTIVKMVLSYVDSLHQMWLPPHLQELKSERYKMMENFDVHNQPLARQAALEGYQEVLATDPDSIEVRERAIVSLRSGIKPQHTDAFDSIVGYVAPELPDGDTSERAYVQAERQGRKATVGRRAIMDSVLNGVRFIGEIITTS